MQTEIERPVLHAENPVRSYPNSMQKLARYFRTVLKNETIAVLADDLDRERRIPAVCVVDDKFRPLGVVKRDKVFLLLGKRFGRELMGKSRVQEIAEEAPVFSGKPISSFCPSF